MLKLIWCAQEEEVGSRRESDEHVPIAKGHSKILEFSRTGVSAICPSPFLMTLIECNDATCIA